MEAAGTVGIGPEVAEFAVGDRAAGRPLGAYAAARCMDRLVKLKGIGRRRRDLDAQGHAARYLCALLVGAGHRILVHAAAAARQFDPLPVGSSARP
jgi:hypothetical protein